MIIYPMPFLARSGIYRGPVRHVAFSADRDGGDSVDLRMFVSGDGRKWHRNGFTGDLRDYLSSAIEPYGAFQPQGIVRSGNRLLMFGAIYYPSISGLSRIGAAFVTEDGREWNRVATPIDGTYPPAVSTDASFTSGAVDPVSGEIVLAFFNGQSVYSDDNGETFAGNGYLAGEGNSIRGIAAAGNGVWMAGRASGGDHYHKNNPTNTPWSALSAPGTWPSGRSNDAFSVGGTVFVSYSRDGYKATAPIGAGTPLTARNAPLNDDYAASAATFQNGRHMVFYTDQAMVVSTDNGVTWSLQTNRPNVGERLNLLLSEPDQILALRRDGKLFESVNDGVTWGEVTAPGIDIASIDVAGSFAEPV